MSPTSRHPFEHSIYHKWEPTREGQTILYHSCNAGLSEETGLYEWQPKGLRVFQVKSPDPGSDVAAVQQGKISITPLRTAFVGA